MNHVNHMDTRNDLNADLDMNTGPSTSLFTLEELQNTPSRRANISEDEENKKRCESITMIRDIGKEMNLNIRTTVPTAYIYFHRFYMVHSMVAYPPRIAVLGCLFLAGKVEETPKKCKDLLSTAQNSYPTVYDKDSINDVMNFEKVLLYTLRFDLQIEHPYPSLLEYVKILQLDDAEKSKVSSLAWTFITDSYLTTLSLMFDPEIIAISLLQMAINMALDPKRRAELKYKDQHEHWWNHFVSGLHPNTLEIIEQIMETFYDESKDDNNSNQKQKKK